MKSYMITTALPMLMCLVMGLCIGLILGKVL